jgi:hypothetical protein
MDRLAAARRIADDTGKAAVFAVADGDEASPRGSRLPVPADRPRVTIRSHAFSVRIASPMI